jgi:hypothetical protein
MTTPSFSVFLEAVVQPGLFFGKSLQAELELELSLISLPSSQTESRSRRGTEGRVKNEEGIMRSMLSQVAQAVWKAKAVAVSRVVATPHAAIYTNAT